MSAPSPQKDRTVRAKKAVAPQLGVVGTTISGPMTFFLRSEADMDKAELRRGRKTSRGSEQTSKLDISPSPTAGKVNDSTYGVQSLEDALSESANTCGTSSTLSRVDSNTSDPSTSLASRKRKAGNPVHPSILAAGNRIISSEHSSSQASTSGSPISLRSAESPFRTHLRRASNSSINLMSQPLTPLRLSPHPESAMPSTPRSASMKSFRLSDEEASVASETHNQAVQSSNEDEDELAVLPVSSEADPQLVMPSLTLPSRRPFTDRGRHMGRLKVMVVGPSGSGKTSLIKSIFRTCEDIVHIDSVTESVSTTSNSKSARTAHEATSGINEIHASTRPYPLWWSDMESSRSPWRRKSFGEGVLERNICFLDTPGIDSQEMADRVLREVENLHLENASTDVLSDNQLLSLFSGDGGTYIDAVLYLTNSTLDPIAESEHNLLRKLASLTNLIPLLGRADVGDGDLKRRRESVRGTLSDAEVDWYSIVDVVPEVTGFPSFESTRQHSLLEPFAVSSALSNDNETMDASLLMASDYLEPLAPSDLKHFIDRFLSPSNIARMRHLSAKKFLQWRKQHLSMHVDLKKQTLLLSPQLTSTSAVPSPIVTNTGSLLDDPSKILVPYNTSSYYRSVSPSTSHNSNAPAPNATTLALASHNTQTEPYRQVRLAKWAQDLQRSLLHDRRRYGNLLPPKSEGDWDATPGASPDVETGDERALTTTTSPSRPPRGKLGGEIAVLDPLGVLAFSQSFSRRGMMALQVMGGLGMIGSACWWVLRNWVEVQEWFGVSAGVQEQQPLEVSATLDAPGLSHGASSEGRISSDESNIILGGDIIDTTPPVQVKSSTQLGLDKAVEEWNQALIDKARDQRPDAALSWDFGDGDPLRINLDVSRELETNTIPSLENSHPGGHESEHRHKDAWTKDQPTMNVFQRAQMYLDLELEHTRLRKDVEAKLEAMMQSGAALSEDGNSRLHQNSPPRPDSPLIEEEHEGQSQPDDVQDAAALAARQERLEDTFFCAATADESRSPSGESSTERLDDLRSQDTRPTKNAVESPSDPVVTRPRLVPESLDVSVPKLSIASNLDDVSEHLIAEFTHKDGVPQPLSQHSIHRDRAERLRQILEQIDPMKVPPITVNVSLTFLHAEVVWSKTTTSDLLLTVWGPVMLLTWLMASAETADWQYHLAEFFTGALYVLAMHGVKPLTSERWPLISQSDPPRYNELFPDGSKTSLLKVATKAHLAHIANIYIASHHNQQAAPTTRVGATANNASPVPLAPLQFLLLCVPFKRHATKLSHVPTPAPVSDTDFFGLLRKQYTTLRGRFRRIFSLRTLAELRFVHFEVFRNDLADVRKYDVIPPGTQKDKYIYNPMPAEFVPPIGKNQLRHLYDHPEDADDQPVCFTRVPRKLHERLVAAPIVGSSEGWGICFIEGISWPKVCGLGLVGVVLSTAFGVLWTVLKGDIQGGFGVASFMLGVLALSVGALQGALEM
nr:hypothetical protein B0A51_03734 [Rachicladosporium sp. CCFEE 5018]